MSNSSTTSSTHHSALQPGDRAPEFTLPSANQDDTVSLADYRGRNPLLLALFVGLWCPFCRRSIAQMGAIVGKLEALGVKALGIVATPPENARLYFKYRPTLLRLGSDPELSAHRAYGVPKPVPTPELMQEIAVMRINPTGELPEPLPIPEAAEALARLDGYTLTQTDHSDVDRQWPQLKGQFLIDRDGIIRWVNIECGQEGLAGIGKFPTEEEILDAVRALRM